MQKPALSLTSSGLSSLHSLHPEGSSYLITKNSQALRSIFCHEGCVSKIGLFQTL